MNLDTMLEEALAWKEFLNTAESHHANEAGRWHLMRTAAADVCADAHGKAAAEAENAARALSLFRKHAEEYVSSLHVLQAARREFVLPKMGSVVHVVRFDGSVLWVTSPQGGVSRFVQWLDDVQAKGWGYGEDDEE